jgi:hypothetical protein
MSIGIGIGIGLDAGTGLAHKAGHDLERAETCRQRLLRHYYSELADPLARGLLLCLIPRQRTAPRQPVKG